MTTNFAKSNVIVGARGTGKTTYVRKCIDAYMKGTGDRRVLVIDTYPSPSYSQYEIITPAQLLVWKRGVKRLIVPAYELDPVFELIMLHDIQNLFVVVEDSQKYFEDKITQTQKTWLADLKNKGRETLFVFHFFTNIPKRMFPMLNGIIIKKTSDTRADVKQRSANPDVLNAFIAVNINPNPYSQKYVQLN